MLILGRRKDESIVIDDRIKITVLRTKGGTIRVGIEAPKDISVRRGELVPFDCELEVPEPKPA